MIHVTDHALVRWLERVAKIDVAAIRAEIASHVPTGTVKADIKLHDGTRVCVDQGMVKTVKPKLIRNGSRKLQKRWGKQRRAREG